METEGTKGAGPAPVFVDQVMVASGGGLVLLTFNSPMVRQIGMRPELMPTVCVAMSEIGARDMIRAIQENIANAEALKSSDASPVKH